MNFFIVTPPSQLFGEGCGFRTPRSDLTEVGIVVGTVGRPNCLIVSSKKAAVCLLSQPRCTLQNRQLSDARCGPLPGPMIASPLPHLHCFGKVTAMPINGSSG